MTTRTYYDPRTGDAITADEFVQRYTVNAFMWIEHPPEAAKKPDLPGLVKFGATCPGCGVGVAKEGDVCAYCEQKPQYAPSTKPMLNLGAQPTPAYQREHEPEGT